SPCGAGPGTHVRSASHLLEYALAYRMWRNSSRWGLDNHGASRALYAHQQGMSQRGGSGREAIPAMGIPASRRRRMFEPEVAQKGVADMARETRNTGIMGDLQRLSATMEANKELLPHLEPFRAKLG